MFERFRRRSGSGAEHLGAKKRNGERLGYLMVIVHRKNGRLYSSVKTRGGFESFEHGMVVAEILRMGEWFKEEMKNNPGISFFDHVKKQT